MENTGDMSEKAASAEQNCVDEMKLWEEVLRKAEVWAQEPYDTETRETVQGWLARAGQGKGTRSQVTLRGAS